MSYLPRCKFGKYTTIYDHVICKNTELGDFTYIAPGTKINNAKIGKFCSIGPDCKIGLGKHPATTFVSTHPIFFSTSKQAQISFVKENKYKEAEPIEIGNDVWIGANVMIMDGVTIGDGAIIAAGAVVTKGVPAYAIVCGVPAKVIKYRFNNNDIGFLQDYQWYMNDPVWLQENVELFHDIKKLKKEISK